VPDVRVRFAPSPTGELHIGGARTALFNYFFVRSAGGKFILRIDDTDLERSRSDYIDKLIDALHWLGMQWDEGPYFQSQRLDIYSSEAERLLLEKKAYRCYCTVEELATGRELARAENRPFLYPGTCRNLSPEKEDAFLKDGRGVVIRLLTPDKGTTIVQDEIRGEVSFENSDLDDFIIIKSNGLPTYNFASIVDDLKMEISHVIRAEEHLSNTPRQILCAAALGYKLPVFAHVPMILAPDRSKLSKRHGATSVEEFRADGFLPEALINYMTLLGWSPGGDKEIFSIDETVSTFKLQKVNKTAAIYDTAKLTWMNSHYIKEFDLDKLAQMAFPFFVAKGLINEELSDVETVYYKAVVDAVRERAKTLVELPEAAAYFFVDLFEYDEKGLKKVFVKEGTAELLRSAAGEMRLLDIFNRETTEKSYNSLSEALGIPLGQLIQPTRLAITGRMGGPGLFEIMELLGRDKTAARLERAALFIDTEL
jgi:glutamyl-tRNA synthetase